MLKKLTVTIGLAAAVAASLGAYYLREGASDLAVSTATPSVGDVVQTVAATGTLEAVRTVEVGSQVSGTIARLFADFNSIVTAGQLLAELDPSLLGAQTEQARASQQAAEAGVDRLRVGLEAARTTAARAEELNLRQLVTLSDLDAARIAVRVAEAQLRAGEAQLVQANASLRQCVLNEQHARIYAPIDGIVTARSVDVGQTVAASMQAPTLFTLAADLSRMLLEASVSESDVGLVREGQAVRFRVDAYPDESFTGSVTQVRLQPTTSQNVVSYTTVIEVANPSLRLRPGMTATTTIEIERRDAVVRAPNTALRFRPTPAMLAALGQPQPAGPAARPGVEAGTAPAAAARPTAGSGKAAAAAAEGRPGKTARVWTWANGRIQPVTLITGISDGTYTEVVSGAPGMDAALVTRLTVPQGTKASSAPTSPLMQQNGPPPGMPPPPPPGGAGPR